MFVFGSARVTQKMPKPDVAITPKCHSINPSMLEVRFIIPLMTSDSTLQCTCVHSNFAETCQVYLVLIRQPFRVLAYQSVLIYSEVYCTAAQLILSEPPLEKAKLDTGGLRQRFRDEVRPAIETTYSLFTKPRFPLRIIGI